jgi:hypothetical protein
MGISPRALSYYLAKYRLLDETGADAPDRAVAVVG